MSSISDVTVKLSVMEEDYFRDIDHLDEVVGSSRPALELKFQAEMEVFESRHKRSHDLWQRATWVMPNGAPTALNHFDPWPLVIERAHNTEVWDIDGHHYYDFHNAFSTVVMGHSNEKIAKAVEKGFSEGAITGFLSPQAIELAEHICERFEADMVQFTNSGTESTQLAIRIARAVTGRGKILKIEGGYHGTHDSVMVSTHASFDQLGDPHRPTSVPWGEGMAPGILDSTIVCQFNDLPDLEILLTAEFACVIMEPVMLNVGFVEPEEGYLQRVRELCNQHGVVLIFDEVKTGVTLAYGGAEEIYQVKPDLKCLAKGIGGGLPLGAVCGKQELMLSIETGETPHYSTFAGNHLAMSAGLACLREVLTPNAYQRLAAEQAALIGGLQKILNSYPNLPAYLVSQGAKGNILFTAPPHTSSYRDWELRADHELASLYWLMMINRGILLSPGQDEQWTISVKHGARERARFLSAFAEFALAAEQIILEDKKN